MLSGSGLVRDLRERRASASAEDLASFETDVLAGFVLARASAGLADSTIRNDTSHLELIRDWFARPLWEIQPTDPDSYFGKVLGEARLSTRTGRAGALTVYFQFLELWHKIEIYNLTGRPRDERQACKRSYGTLRPKFCTITGRRNKHGKAADIRLQLLLNRRGRTLGRPESLLRTPRMC